MWDHTRWRFGLLAPILSGLIFLIVWLLVGWGPLDRLELPLARLIHASAGRWDAVDEFIMFLNRWRGEAIFVLIAFTAFFVVATRATPVAGDRRRIIGFAAAVFAVWLAANWTNDHLMEPFFERKSPSFMLAEDHRDLAVLHERKVKVRSKTSFPSNHGTVFMLVFVMSAYRYGRSTWVLLPIMTFLSLPRCFTGAHWVSDTLLGSLLMTWIIAALVMATSLRHVVDLVERAAVRLLPEFFGGPGYVAADLGAPSWSRAITR